MYEITKESSQLRENRIEKKMNDIIVDDEYS